MKTYEQLKHEWGASTCGREFSFYVYKYLQSYAREVADKAYDAGYKARMSSNYVPTKEEFMKQLDI